MSPILLIVAVVLGVWAALADAGHITLGEPMQLLALAVASGFAAFLPWWTRRP